MTNSERLSPEGQQEILKKIGISLLDAVSDSWDVIKLKFSEIGRSGSSETQIIHKDGREETIGTPNEVIFHMSKLRSGMYKQNQGTWFSVVYEIRRPGSFSVDYNYNNDPPLNFTPVNSQYAVDMQRFPRSSDATPEWLRLKADAAEWEE